MSFLAFLVFLAFLADAMSGPVSFSVLPTRSCAGMESHE